MATFQMIMYVFFGLLIVCLLGVGVWLMKKRKDEGN